MRPPFVVRSLDVPESEGAYPPPFDAEKLTFGRDLGTAAGTRTLGAWRERLPPGRRTSFTHAHQREEELVYVLSGSPSVRWIEPGAEPRETELAAGDFVAFPAGTGIAHCLVNHSGEDAELLVVGERRPGERASYPEDGEFAAWRAEKSPLRAWDGDLGPDPDAAPPACRIETARLVLRPWTEADVRDFHAMSVRNREHLVRWIPRVAEIMTLDDRLALVRRWQQRFVTGEDRIYAMFAAEGRPIGSVGFHDRVGPRSLEIGYWIDAEHEGRGYVTEAVAALVRVGFEVHDVVRLEIRCEPDNVRSAAVPARLGFTHETTLRRRAIGHEGALVDLMVWARYAEDPAGGERAPMRAWDGLGRRLL